VINFFGTILLFLFTAGAEITGCYLVFLWLKKDMSYWLLVPAALSLAIFSWLLTLHPGAAARTYAGYGGIYIFTAILWLWWVERQRPTLWTLLGALVSVLGMIIIIFADRSK
jgi:small multidrug resistance family-3 protein